MKKLTCRWVLVVLIIWAVSLCNISHSPVAEAVEIPNSYTYGQADTTWTELESRVAGIWGPENALVPQPKFWIQYEAGLSERSAVDFENGIAFVQILLDVKEDPKSELVLAHLRQGVGKLILEDAKDPTEMIKILTSGKKRAVHNEMPEKTVSPAKEIRVYLIQKGDSLWKIARRFDMSSERLAELNGIDTTATLSIGRPLKVKVTLSHDLTLDSSPPTPGKDPLLLDQIRMVDGRPVSPWLVEGFVAEIAQSQSVKAERITGADGFQRQVVTVQFKLVSNHLAIRARKFHPLVQSYAKKHNLDPALIMAIIHTESMFNPRARSHTPAYGLMQLVPHSGARDAYLKVYGQKRNLTSQYLYDPKNNIELGVAYFDILRNSYMKSIEDPISRTYCAVAAYNAGAANVGRAFVHKKSMNLATPVINGMEPQEVYARLIDDLPFKESRNYIEKVMGRSNLYSSWQ